MKFACKQSLKHYKYVNLYHIYIYMIVFVIIPCLSFACFSLY